MGKYANHQDFGTKAPAKYREDTTIQSYLKGLSAIAPPGMKPRTIRGQRFEERTDPPASTRWHRNYDLAMFGASEVLPPVRRETR